MRLNKHVTRFANYCFGAYGVKPIPIVLVNYPAIAGEDGGIGFGVYWQYGERQGIYIAGRCLTKRSMLETIGHEISHYATGNDDDELMDQKARVLLERWYERRRKKHESD